MVVAASAAAKATTKRNDTKQKWRRVSSKQKKEENHVLSRLNTRLTFAPNFFHANETCCHRHHTRATNREVVFRTFFLPFFDYNFNLFVYFASAASASLVYNTIPMRIKLGRTVLCPAVVGS